jgi:type VI secretion system protein ImpM
VPAADLTPGFFGKIPATGDFVTRRLAGDFVRHWDRFAARHLVPLLATEQWTRDLTLRFLLGPAAHGPMAGIVLASSDRIGRRFPLTVAAPIGSADTGMATAANGWFSAIHDAARAAQEGRLDADQLAAELSALPFPANGTAGTPVRGLVLWTRPSELFQADLDAPQAALERIFALSREAG